MFIEVQDTDGGIGKALLREMFNREDLVEVTFTKKDGTVRVMKCTRNLKLIPGEHHPDDDSTNDRTSPDVLPVWDLEAEGWRSFRLDSVISMKNFG